MDWQQGLDWVLRAMAALSGIGLAGLIVVRTTPRGRWKLIGMEGGPLFDPKTAKVACMVAWTFAFLVVLVLARAGGRFSFE